MYTLTDFDFDLPAGLIAQMPLPERTGSRLLDASSGLADRLFSDIVDLIAEGDLLVFNDTRVIKARLFGAKQTGGQLEVLIERIFDGKKAIAKIRASKSPKSGTIIRLENAFDVEVGERQGEFFSLTFPEDIIPLLDRYGHMPLPPYIERSATGFDETRYQTVYAKTPGAVAAPTAGLHFDPPLIDRLQEKGVRTAHVTLHVGAGTFQPVRTENLAEHQMHAEQYTIPEATARAIQETRAAGRQVIAVGTTSLRALEAASQDGALLAGSGETRLFITPGYRFHSVDRLLTNFHLPKSTLLMLVSAFAGYARIREAYTHAIAKQYRFFSYGDAMLLNCAT
ncbi:tRNA preQ1(34) S-adenosylmethionine ribosyltransferase-isomerase QueA [Oxalobacter sp. OttesenSCG-928-P03]|nr:tRNA preQ1(34) S-adenosylmethionine ribosyltransferase-isomerase QueA [Oxalobacter sp. OttesenSCG-928-P03]